MEGGSVSNARLNCALIGSLRTGVCREAWSERMYRHMQASSRNHEAHVTFGTRRYSHRISNSPHRLIND